MSESSTDSHAARSAGSISRDPDFGEISAEELVDPSRLLRVKYDECAQTLSAPAHVTAAPALHALNQPPSATPPGGHVRKVISAKGCKC